MNDHELELRERSKLVFLCIFVCLFEYNFLCDSLSDFVCLFEYNFLCESLSESLSLNFKAYCT